MPMTLGSLDKNHLRVVFIKLLLGALCIVNCQQISFGALNSYHYF